MRIVSTLLASLLCLPAALALSALLPPALRAELKEGDAAPALTIEKWVKGDPVNIAEGKGKKTFVVEFWATWCGPCVRGIPHITKMAERFGKSDVVFIGVSIDGPETRSRVEPFVQEMGKKMGYTVATDKDRTTQTAWLDAAGAQGIPHAFVVSKEGKIAWQGHPMAGLGKKLAELVGDKDYIAIEEKKDKATGEIQKALQEENWPDVLKHLEVLMSVDPEETQLWHFKYHVLSVKLKEKEKARKWGETLVEKLDSVQDLNGMAWNILTDEEQEAAGRDTDLALKAARKAVGLAGGRTWSTLDTLALAQFLGGDPAEAVKTQKEAIELARKEKEEVDDSILDQLEQSLKRFEKGPGADNAGKGKPEEEDDEGSGDEKEDGDK